jgi:hypothetical protein
LKLLVQVVQQRVADPPEEKEGTNQEESKGAILAVGSGKEFLEHEMEMLGWVDLVKEKGAVSLSIF